MTAGLNRTMYNRLFKGAVRPLLLWVVPVLAIGIGWLIYYSQANYVSTDNAYVRMEKTSLSPYVSGHIEEIFVQENDEVEKGQLLLRIDSEDARIKVEQGKALLEAARTSVKVLKATYELQQAEVTVALDQAKFSRNKLERQKELAAKKMASQSDVDDAEQEYELMKGAALVVKQMVNETITKLSGNTEITIENHPDVQSAKASLEMAQLMLSRSELRAPRNGVVSQLPYVGDTVAAGVPALSIVSEHNPWIEVNFKETEITGIKPGLPAEIKIDTYPDNVWHGHVESISQATGAEFALLPPQNSSGNWVKVVQRIPVRIAIDDYSESPVLRAGMSAHVKVELESGS